MLPSQVPAEILLRCRDILGTDIRSVQPVSGGDINQAFRLEAPTGSFFLKTNTGPQAGRMFGTEAAGLGLLASAGALRTPAVLGFGETPQGAFLLLEFIETGFRPPVFWEKFGTGLAHLHRSSAEKFGLGHDNFIGSLPQSNSQHDTWASFYIHERLLPQLDLAKQSNRLQSADFQDFEILFKKLPDLCPAEPPALTHGDLWSGNFLCSTAGQPVLIDPAVSYAHREMDLAMSRLFGGFERPFYRSYEAAWPLAPGFEQRLPVYQLYYLLVHVNLFGGGYVGSVRSALGQLI
ncbi:MAG: fructosamine kinase family protein [Bacteroidetes bacterium]|nr:fructosamine kinase family protein [Bacteroidota bacterium]